MKVNQISYSRTFHLGDSNFEKLSIDIELEKGDTEEAAYTHAKKVIAENKIPEGEVFEMLSKALKPPTSNKFIGVKMIADSRARAEYEKAAAEGNEAVMNRMETIFDVESLMDN
ncbi:MAG: hypothetical protein ABIP68_06745 [Ferruginibacter sp.]